MTLIWLKRNKNSLTGNFYIIHDSDGGGDDDGGGVDGGVDDDDAGCDVNAKKDEPEKTKN